MTKQSQHSYQVIFIGVMLFALFFGAGNLIFPVMLGQLSGDHVWIASLGFVSTGVLLPLLGVIALGVSGESDFLKVSQRVGVIFGLVFATTLYLTIGPLFAMPRTGSVSYEIAIKPFINQDDNQIYLGIFTLFYFGICFLLSINPNKIVDIVGKILTPIMLLFIAILVISTLVYPMGEPLPAVNQDYQSNPFFTGFKNGYLTMDTLASFIFGIIVIYHIAQTGIKSRSGILSACLKASLISGGLLAAVYVSLAYLGASSVTELGILENGGQVLVKTSIYYFGPMGNILLGIIVMMACLTTSIGLTTACANYFHKLLPALSYQRYALIFSIVSMLFANIGLTELISISVPILSVVYPLTIVLIVLTFFHKWFGGKKAVYAGAMYFTLLISIFDGLNEADIPLTVVNQYFEHYLPLYSAGVGWVLPAFIGALGGYLYSLMSTKK